MRSKASAPLLVLIEPFQLYLLFFQDSLLESENPSPRLPEGQTDPIVGHNVIDELNHHG